MQMFHKLCAAYQAVEEKIDVLSLQYRVLLFAAIWVVVFIVWYLLGVTTMQGYRENLLLTRTSATKQLTIVEQRIVAIKRAAKNNENKKLSTQYQQLQKQKAAIDKKTQVYEGEMISAKKMVGALQTMLKKVSGLRLIDFKQLSHEPVEVPKSIGEKRITADLYRTSVQFTFQGGYFAVVDYLKHLQGVSWRLFWDEFRYEVTKYPVADITVTVHTLSQEDEDD
jgi:MSHA biogenesis protein MshJ